jgi:hypothetical protein
MRAAGLECDAGLILQRWFWQMHAAKVAPSPHQYLPYVTAGAQVQSQALCTLNTESGVASVAIMTMPYETRPDRQNGVAVA